MSRLHAPELAPALAWINTGRPLAMEELRGQLVVLDFWTACCVNCMHVIPMLADLEDRHAADPVVVIGVHSGKFAAETRPERVAAAVRRYGVRHPVVVDRDMQIWQRYGVRSWPTLVVIEPGGTIAAVAPGEPDPAVLEQVVQSELRSARDAGKLADRPFAVPPASSDLVFARGGRAATRPPGQLAYPGKVAVHPDGRIAVADSGHHRVLVLAPSGEVLHTIGAGLPGHAGGRLESALFDEPQGLAWDGELLWICDARAHTLVRADLYTGLVTTLAGTGEMGLVPVGAGPRPGREVALRSPWDVVVDDTRLYLALAGSHQLAAYDKAAGTIEQLAGTGREALVDGQRRDACFAQPSGLCLDGRTLWVADSEASAVRALDLTTGEVTTAVGAGLFDFGLVDGGLDEARLQHPLQVARDGAGRLVVADTYNDALRALDTRSGRVTTLYRGEGEAALSEPSGLAVLDGGDLLVADTNAHRLVRVTAAGAFAGTLAVRSAPAAPVATPSRRGAPAPSPAAVRWFELTPASADPLRPGETRLRLTVTAPAGWKLNADSPVHAVLEVSRRGDLLVPLEPELSRPSGGQAELVLSVAARVEPLPAPRVDSELCIVVDTVLCREGEFSVCAPARGWYRIPVTLASEGSDRLRATLALAAPEA